MDVKNEANKVIYLDNSATTKPLAEVNQAIEKALTDDWGNPSSLHHLGVEAEKVREKARTSVAKALGADAKEIFFSPSGSVASNVAISGTLIAKRRRGKHIVTTAVEHSSIWNTVRAWEAEGYTLDVIEPQMDGTGFAEQMAEKVTNETVLVTMMHVNNETGTVFPVEEAARLCKEKNPNVTVHVDAVQSFLKIPFSSKDSAIDLLSVSAHKIHGPKGVGALYIGKGTNIKPILFGGGQEGAYFPGTESVPLIAGFGTAVEMLSGNVPEAYTEARKKQEFLCEKLEEIPSVKVLSPANGSPYITAFTLPGILSENTLHFLEARGIYVSIGSACAKGKLSRSLEGFHLNRKEAEGYIRASISRFTQVEELEALVEGIKEASTSLQKKR